MNKKKCAVRSEKKNASVRRRRRRRRRRRKRRFQIKRIFNFGMF